MAHPDVAVVADDLPYLVGWSVDLDGRDFLLAARTMGESQDGEQRGDERDGECAIQGDLVRDWIGAANGGARRT